MKLPPSVIGGIGKQASPVAESFWGKFGRCFGLPARPETDRATAFQPSIGGPSAQFGRVNPQPLVLRCTNFTLLVQPSADF